MKKNLETRTVPQRGPMAALTIMLIVTFMTRTIAQSCASSAGPLSGSTFGTAPLTSSLVSWSNPSYAQTTDGNSATADLLVGANSTAWSNYLTVQGFNFSIPSSATICKIIVDVVHSYSGIGVGASVSDQSVMIMQNGTRVGTDQRNSGAWPGSDGSAQYGNSVGNYLWGTTWTPADVNNANFGVAIAAKFVTGLASLTLTPRINQVTITIVYDAAVLGLGLQRFSVTHGADGNLISWSVTDTPPALFTIQRSTDSKAWSDIANIDPSQPMTAFGANAFTEISQEHDYAYTDHSAPTGASYYRIRTVTADGQSHYSAISLVTNDVSNGNGKRMTRCWPNPFMTSINISSAQPLQRITISDAQGHPLQNIRVEADIHDRQIATGSLPPGIYFLHAGGETFRLIKIRQ